ncbi:hypothetical protein [Micromonospora sp. LOL_024]|uniref:hypothetical protein n=1 Tax=Micromonospora sp. LOL_024 TaxID=3345412 RepID=UPI003A846C70
MPTGHVRWVIDPVDYLQPLVFDTDGYTWRDRSKKARIKALDRIRLGRPRVVKAFVGTQSMTAHDGRRAHPQLRGVVQQDS